MRVVRYSVAASLDGFIADATGAFDWIPMDPDVDFGALFGHVDTVLLGRRSFELVRAQGGPAPWRRDARVYVFSDTLAQADVAEATVVRRAAAEDTVARLRAEPESGEIWLFGGGSLFGSLVAAGQVDVVEVTVVPVLLGAGVPLLALPPVDASSGRRTALELAHVQRYPKSGLVALQYRVIRARA